MEEGPEPNEWVEKSVEHHHQGEEHGHGDDSAKKATTISAITAALLAVCAALGSLLSGHAANEAILKQSKATDQWAYFQAKSVKGHIYEVAGELVKTLAPEGSEKTKSSLDKFERQVKKYDKEKEDIQEEAKGLEKESTHELHKHHSYALGVSIFQVGIVLASISIMIRYRPIWLLSLVAGAGGVVMILMGLFH